MAIYNQAEKTQRKPDLPNLDVGLLASRTVRKLIQLFKKKEKERLTVLSNSLLLNLFKKLFPGFGTPPTPFLNKNEFNPKN